MAVTECTQRFYLPSRSLPKGRKFCVNAMNIKSTSMRGGEPLSAPPHMRDFSYHISTPVHSPLLSRETSSDVDSLMPTQLLSPISVKAEIVNQVCGLVNSFGQPQRCHLKRKLGNCDEDDGFVSLPGFRSLLSYHESLSHSPEPSPLLTPSTSPEPSEADLSSRRPSLFLTQDPITEKLNRLRKGENKNPLPPLQALCGTALYTYKEEQYQQSSEPSASRKARKRRAKSKNHPHCNIKYAVEELDYIRYQRIDIGQEWDAVEAKFHEKFPMIVFPEERQKQGLQGVYYRQNSVLPRIVDGQLVFMDNGHVEPVCVKTREQSEEKQLYTLVNLFPERAMYYDWVSPKDRQRAREISKCLFTFDSHQDTPLLFTFIRPLTPISQFYRVLCIPYYSIPLFGTSVADSSTDKKKKK